MQKSNNSTCSIIIIRSRLVMAIYHMHVMVINTNYQGHRPLQHPHSGGSCVSPILESSSLPNSSRFRYTERCPSRSVQSHGQSEHRNKHVLRLERIPAVGRRHWHHECPSSHRRLCPTVRCETPQHDPG